MMNVTSSYGSGARSRSRSRSRSRRSIGRSRSVPALSMVRRLNYGGDTRLTRTLNANFSVTADAGISLGATNYQEALFTFSPTGATLWGSNVNYTVCPLPNASELASLWERVKIEKVELTFSTDGTDHVGIGTAPAHSGMEIVLANDTNGPTTGSTTSISNVLQMAGVKRFKVGGNHPLVRWTCRPKYQRLIQYTSINSSYEPASGHVQSDTDIPHYGVRIGLTNAVNVNACTLQCTAKFYLSLKNVH